MGVAVAFRRFACYLAPEIIPCSVTSQVRHSPPEQENCPLPWPQNRKKPAQGDPITLADLVLLFFSCRGSLASS